MRHKSLFALLCLVLVWQISPSQPAQASEQVGEAVKIQRTVKASQGNRTLGKADPVFSKEQITAEIDAHGELQLTDRSRVVVGSNSTISLDDFIVSGSRIDKGTIRVAKGAFRFITGSSQKGTFSVKTPLATIGVRGTIFDVYVDASGVEHVVLFSGRVDVCSSAGCETASRSCDIIRIEPGGAPQSMPYLKSASDTSDQLDFNLLDAQQRFGRKWRAPIANCHARAAMDSLSNPPSVNDGGPGNTGQSGNNYGGTDCC